MEKHTPYLIPYETIHQKPSPPVLDRKIEKYNGDYRLFLEQKYQKELKEYELSEKQYELDKQEYELNEIKIFNQKKAELKKFLIRASNDQLLEQICEYNLLADYCKNVNHHDYGYYLQMRDWLTKFYFQC